MFESKAMARGFDAVEMTYQRVVDFSTRVFRGEVDAYQLSEEAGLSLRGEYRGGIGYYYSELIDVAVIEEALEAMMKSAELMEVKEEFIPESDAVLSDEADYHPDLGEIHYPSVMPKMVAMEEALKERDAAIGEVPYNLYAMVERELRIMNSRGMDLSQRFNLNYYVLSALAREGERGKTAMDFKVSSRPDLFEDQGFTLGIAREARDLLAARPVPSGKIPVLLNNRVAAQFLGGFASLFSAEMVDKDLSLLKGRLGEKIGADILNILDDPTEERALIHRQFDDEGTLTRRQKLVEEGVLKAYLHNTKTGRKMGMSPGGNGLREGIKSQLGISPTNFFIEPGNRSLEAMITDVEYGLLITQIQALHSGLNAVSGDFSLPAQGYLIRDGKIQGSVDQITISSNIMAVFNQISDIGEDLYFHIPNGMGSVGSPSLLIEGISVAGE
jgi:PmbA protein